MHDASHSKPLLIVKDLSFAFGRRPIFSSLGFTLHSGEILHVRGVNGVGKSTLLHVCAGLLSVQRGDLTWDTDVRVAYLPAEGNGLYGECDATTNLHFWQALAGQTPDTQTWLQRWGLGHALIARGLKVKRFSTGMKRRLGLARITTSGAQVWILDEPLQGLDTSARGLFADALTEHLKQGGAALLVSHELEHVERVRHLNVRYLDLAPGGTHAIP